MLTTQGGVDIEEVAEKSPEALARLHVDPLAGFQPFQARWLCFTAGITDPGEQKQVIALIGKLYEAFVASDAMLCEVNPLIVTPEGEVRALDSKFTVDDNALGRHPEVAEMRDLDAYPPEERAAREKGVTYVKLDGEVGILGNGAGLVMSTLDVVAQAGGRAANFCDLGGGGDAEGVVDALGVITADPQVREHPLQHLRRDHARRRGRARDPRGARPARDPPADRRPPRRDERRGGPAHARRRPRRPTCTSRRRCSPRPSARSSSRVRRPPDGDPRRQRHAARRPGHHRPRGDVPRDPEPRLRHERRRGRDAREGRTGRRRNPGLRLGARRGRGDGREHRDGLRARRASRRTRSTRPSTRASRR